MEEVTPGEVKVSTMYVWWAGARGEDWGGGEDGLLLANGTDVLFLGRGLHQDCRVVTEYTSEDLDISLAQLKQLSVCIRTMTIVMGNKIQ